MAGNLRQIGGGQNTSGEESIVEGVGLGPQRQVIAAGSFPAPQTPGTYVLHLDAPLANVLVAVNPPPASSPTEPADVTVTLPGSRMEFTVGCRCGDIDGVGSKVNLGDFGMFALCYGRSAPSGDCTIEVFECSDLDGSGAVNLSDFGTFALLYGSLSTNAVPDCLP